MCTPVAPGVNSVRALITCVFVCVCKFLFDSLLMDTYAISTYIAFSSILKLNTLTFANP